MFGKHSIAAAVLAVSLCATLGGVRTVAASCEEPSGGARRTLGPVIVDGTWDRLPKGASPGLTVDDTGALTLRSDPSSVEFLLLPAPEDDAMVNSIVDLKCIDGKLYPGYGDWFNNQGPLDLLHYDPSIGTTVRELADVPEEQIAHWHVDSDGRLIVTGQDSKESHEFSNFLVKGSLGWQKLRTIHDTAHAFEVLEFRGNLFARYAVPAGGPDSVSYPFVLTSPNGGASWQFQRIAEGEVGYQFLVALETVGKGAAERLYAIAILQPAGSTEFPARLFRHDGESWDELEITDSNGRFSPWELREFQGGLLVNGNVFDDQTGAFIESAYYHVTADGQTELPDLRGRRVYLSSCTSHDGSLYCAERAPVDHPDAPRLLHRIDDVASVVTLGAIAVSPGADVTAIEFCRERLYVGATNRGWNSSVPDVEVFPVTTAGPIDEAMLTWGAIVPDGASLSLRVRTATTFAELAAAPWVGPDGTENTAFVNPGEALSAVHAEDTLFAVKIFKTEGSNGTLPVLRWVRLVDTASTVTVAVDEGPGVYAATHVGAPAEFKSRKRKLRRAISGGALFFDATTPDGTSVEFQMRSANSVRQLRRKPFVGPDGDPESFYDYDGQPLWSGHHGHRYLQYRLVLSAQTATKAPFLRKVAIVTRDDELARFDVKRHLPASQGSAEWVAGERRRIRVVPRDAAGHRVRLHGRVRLSAVDAELGVPVPIHPEEIDLGGGGNFKKVRLERSVPTRICAAVAGVESCSEIIEVKPAEAAALRVASNLQPPIALWSPVVDVGEEFELTVEAVDVFGNTATDYTGSVSCKLWQGFPVDAPPLLQFTFQPADDGVETFGVSGWTAGELNLVCADEVDPGVSGTLTLLFR